MSTLNYSNVDYNIVYVDPTIGENAGDGSTPAGALLDLPTTLSNYTCYLIRRTEETWNVKLKQTRNTGLTHILFLGMPFKDTPMYENLPEEVKTAWGDDLITYKYANVIGNVYYSDYGSNWDYTLNASLFYEWNINTFLALNCYFLRDNTPNESNVSVSGYGALGFMFCFPCNNLSANITFDNCKFGYTQYDLDNDDWLSHNADITENENWPQRKARNYVGVWSANNLTFDNCIFNFVSHSSNTTSNEYYSYLQPGYQDTVVYVHYFCRTFNFNNCTLNTLHRYCYWYYGKPYNVYGYGICYSRAYSEDTGNGSILSDYRRDDYVNINNLTLNAIVTLGYYIDRPLMLNINRCDHLKVNGISLNIKAMKDADVNNINVFRASSFSNEEQYFNSKFIRFGYVRKSIDIDDIDIDLRDAVVKLSNANILEMYDVPSLGYGNPNSSIKNIYIALAQNRNQLNQNNFSSARYYGSVGDIVAIRCDPNQWRWESNYDGRWYKSSGMDSSYVNFENSYIIKDIIVEAQYSDTWALSLANVGAKSRLIKGRVYLNASTFDVDKIYNYRANSTGISLNNNSFIKCNEYEADLTQTEFVYSGNRHMSYNWIDGLASAYINKTNVILFDEGTGSGYFGMSSQCQFICPNYILQGQYFGKNSNTFCKSWNVVRENSNAVATLRFNNNTCSLNPPRLYVGMDPYKGIVATPLSIGKKTAVCYVACKNFSDPELVNGNTNFVVEINCPYFETDKLDPEKRVLYYKTYSSCGKMWKADSSVWSGDTNLRGFRFEIPIEVFTLDEQLDIKVWYNWYAVNGYCYFDPDVKLIDVA